MKFLLSLLVLVIAGAAYYFWGPETPTKLDLAVPPQKVGTTTKKVEIDQAFIDANKGNPKALPAGIIEEGVEYNTYTNTSWGFAFNFPKDWEVIEPIFGSATTLFNLGVYPINGRRIPHNISINITPKYWIDGVLEAYPENISGTANLAGVNAIFYKSIMYENAKTETYFFNINNSYWIALKSITSDDLGLLYPNEWAMVRDSFRFLE